MKLKDLFLESTSFFDKEFDSKDEAFEFLAENLLKEKIISDKNIFLEVINKRENEGSTALEKGIAIPHALDTVVLKPVISFIKLKNKIEGYNTLIDDQPVEMIFMISTTGDEGGSDHLMALGELSSKLMNEEIIKKIKKSKNFKELITAISFEKEKNEVKNDSGKYDVIGITACPTGIAHTYMAQEKLEEYASELGMTVKIETQGRRGTENRLTAEDVKNAKVIILAHDKALTGMDRFNGIEVIDTTTKDAIFNGKQLIEQYDENKNKKTIQSKGGEEDTGDLSFKKFKDIKGNLLAGVSRMLPFVVAGGIILGIGFLLDIGTSGTDGLFGTHRPIAGWFSAIGKTGMSMMVPVLAAYIAYTIVGPQGLMPGMVGGLFASSIMSFSYGSEGSWANMWDLIPGVTHTDSGFLGGIAAGFLAALFVMVFTRWLQPLKKGLHGVRDIVLIPVMSLLFVAISMFIINIPLGYIMHGLSEGITWLANHKLLPLVAAIIGLMMCIDMGGPINKIAYSLGVLSVGNGLITDETSSMYSDQTIIMAAAMFAGMLPPIMIAMSTIMFKSAWTDKDRDAAKVNWLMGAFFITEGAIPFMIKDMKRVAISSMIGGLLIGILVGFFGIKIGAPHGGVLTFPLISFGSNGIIDLGIKSQGAQIGVGIVMSLGIILGSSAVAGTILGLWRKKDIKSGKLQLN